MLRVLKHRAYRSVLDDLAGIKKRNAVADLRDDAEIVGDKQHAGAVRLLHAADKAENFLLDRYVERRRRFVGDDQFRIDGEGRGDQHALAHAAGEVVRKACHHPVGIADLHVGEQLQGTCFGRPGRKPPVEPEPIRQLGADAAARIERRLRVLRDQGDFRTHDAPQFGRLHAQKIAALEIDPAAGDANGAGQDAEDRLGDGRLAGAAFADEAADLAFFRERLTSRSTGKPPSRSETAERAVTLRRASVIVSSPDRAPGAGRRQAG